MGTVKGRKFTSKTNGKSIFLPAAGNRSGDALNYSGTYGYYWSSSLSSSYSYNAVYLLLYSGNAYRVDFGRLNGLSVRPVLKK